MTLDERRKKFERFRVALPPEFVGPLEAAIPFGAIARSTVDRCFPLYDSRSRGRFLDQLRRFSVVVLNDDEMPSQDPEAIMRQADVLIQREWESPELAKRIAQLHLCKTHLPREEQIEWSRRMAALRNEGRQIVRRVPVVRGPVISDLRAYLDAQEKGMNTPEEYDRLITYTPPTRWWRSITTLSDQIERIMPAYLAYRADLEQTPRNDVHRRNELTLRVALVGLHLGMRYDDLLASLRQLRGIKEEYLRIRAILVVTNGKLVAKIAFRYAGRGVEVEDLIQDGFLGLITAVERYNPELGFSLTTYATWWIRQAITRAIQNFARTVRVPVHVLGSFAKIAQMRKRLTLELGKPPTLPELAEALETSVAKVRAHMSAVSAESLSLDQPMGDGSDSDFTLLERIPDEKSNAAIADARKELLGRALDQELLQLSEREERVLRSRFGLDGSAQAMTLEEVGAFEGMTRERVRQIEQKALERLRHPDCLQRLVPYLPLSWEQLQALFQS